MKGKYQPVTPLTKSNTLVASKMVKARKAQDAVYRDLFTYRKEQTPKQRPSKSRELALCTCATCGGQLSRGQHVHCPKCWESQPGQEEQIRAKRGAAISNSKQVSKAWRESHPEGRVDLETYLTEILPMLQEVTLSTIMKACGVSKSTASTIRSGKFVPAERHLAALRNLSASRFNPIPEQATDRLQEQNAGLNTMEGRCI